MASLIRRRSSKAANAVAEGKNPTVFCKKHPKHRQSPGVCSLCLNEKLSQFIAAKASSSCSSARTTRLSSSSSLSSLSSYDSSSVSSCPSPLDLRLVSKGISWLTKSRSVACVPRNVGKRDYDDDQQKRRDKGGWLSNLIGPRRINKRF